MLTDTLVVLGLRENLIVGTISQHKDTALDTTHEFLDNHSAGGISKHTTQHLLQLFLGLIEGRKNQHTLTRTEAVSLQHVGRL